MKSCGKLGEARLMSVKLKQLTFVLIMVIIMGFFQIAAASDLIVVADQSAQETSVNWFGFLESKEVPFTVVLPEDFGNHKKESYIVVMGTVGDTGTVRTLAKDALSAAELKSIEETETGEAFFKSDVWKPRQKVILFLGSDQEMADEARKSSKDHWWGMFVDWFEIEGSESLHLY